MKLLVVMSVLWIGCSDEELALDEVESALDGTQYQGTQYQGTQYQGTQYQGTQYQGTQYQGTQYQGATYGGTALTDNVTITGTAIGVWVATSATTWDLRKPDQICTYVLGGNHNNQRVLTGCTTVDLNTTPSPLTGVTFGGTFKREDGTTFDGVITVGGSPTQIGAVTADTSLAMHPVGSTIGQVSGPNSGCDHPYGCKINSDIWLYDLRVTDASGASLGFCSSTGTRATALAGVYDTTGQRTTSTTKFTFACTNGTIAKCTQWGYRSFGTARKWSSSGQSSSLYSMADYHQACVRAAAADYCATGVSFTKNGTIVDIWDYNPSRVNDFGFVPRTDGGTFPSSTVTGLVWESGFDKLGAIQIDHSRFQDAKAPTIDATCAGTFTHGSNDVVCPLGSTSCEYRAAGWTTSPVVWVDSTPACSHSERLVGKWLHDNCSTCTARVKTYLPYCTDPLDPKGWNAACVAKAKAVCSSAQQMTATHGECTVGAKLDPYDSGCTIAVCSNPATSYCCTSTWDAACTNAANSSTCSFAKAGTFLGLCASQPTTM